MKKEDRLLAEMASIGRMCRGKVSVRRQGKSGGEYFVLQCWRAGGNRCRYVHPARRAAYEQACEGYGRFMSRAESYADSVIARTEYGSPVTAAVAKDKVWATQFHPEKSGNVGLAILRAFAEN